jgi:hypothetical protein
MLNVAWGRKRGFAEDWRFTMTYAEYLQTEHWRILRDSALVRDGLKCVRCNETCGLNVHHKFYRQSWLDTEVSDLETLCHIHHKIAHGKYKPRKRGPKSISRKEKSRRAKYRAYRQELSRVREARKLRDRRNQAGFLTALFGEKRVVFGFNPQQT